MKRKFLLLLACVPFIFAGFCSSGGGTPSCPTVADFCPSWYLQVYPGVAAVPEFAKCPQLHYVRHGQAEGYKKCPSSTPEDPVLKPSTGIVTKLKDYTWFLAPGKFNGEDRLYAGAYRDGKSGSVLGSDNYYYRINPITGAHKPIYMASNDESTRVYNLGGTVYTTTEGGVIWRAGQRLTGNSEQHFYLGAELSNGEKYFSWAKKWETVIYKEVPGNKLVHHRTVKNSFGFHLTDYRGSIAVIGSKPGSYRKNGSIVHWNGRFIYNGNSSDKTTAVRGYSFADRLFVGVSYPAQVWSFDKNGGRAVEKVFSGFDHFGDLHVYNGRLHAMIVKEGGHPEIHRRINGQWHLWKGKAFFDSLMPNLGVSGGLVNAAGFLTVIKQNGKEYLFASVNKTNTGRNGEGIIIQVE